MVHREGRTGKSASRQAGNPGSALGKAWRKKIRDAETEISAKINRIWKKDL